MDQRIMAEHISVQRIQLPVAGIVDLHEEARAEGIDFIDTLVTEWETGENRFDKQGETLCGSLANGELIAVGGLTVDPFIESGKVGRIRRVYVRTAWRNRGIGQNLVETLVAAARKGFTSVRLRAENDDAGRLYERIGFLPIDDENATHQIIFEV
jgi:GNAT superfamily N-acetyltransferase